MSSSGSLWTRSAREASSTLAAAVLLMGDGASGEEAGTEPVHKCTTTAGAKLDVGRDSCWLSVNSIQTKALQP